MWDNNVCIWQHCSHYNRELNEVGAVIFMLALLACVPPAHAGVNFNSEVVFFFFFWLIASKSLEIKTVMHKEKISLRMNYLKNVFFLKWKIIWSQPSPHLSHVHGPLLSIKVERNGLPERLYERVHILHIEVFFFFYTEICGTAETLFCQNQRYNRPRTKGESQTRSEGKEKSLSQPYTNFLNAQKRTVKFKRATEILLTMPKDSVFL